MSGIQLHVSGVARRAVRGIVVRGMITARTIRTLASRQTGEGDVYVQILNLRDRQGGCAYGSSTAHIFTLNGHALFNLSSFVVG